jgi:hypothetical protein
MTGFEIAAVGNAAGQNIGNPLFAHLTNVKNRKFTREMYKVQRRDALSDWEMMNAYNSPAAQMSRFKQAGLNPHLIYGQSNEGATVRSSQASGGSAEAPRIGDSTGALMSMYDMKMRSAQTDLVAQQLEVAKEDAAYRRAQIIATIASANLTEVQKENMLFELGVKRELRDITIEGAKTSLEEKKRSIDKIIAETVVTLDQNERAAAMQVPNLERAYEEVQRVRKENAKLGSEKEKIDHEIMLMKKEGVLKDYDIIMRSKGINPGDPGFWKVLQYLIDLGKGGIKNDPAVIGKQQGGYSPKRRGSGRPGLTATDSQ